VAQVVPVREATDAAPVRPAGQVPAPDFLSGAALIAFDPDLRVVVWNEAAEELTGIPAAEAIGRHCWQVLGGDDDGGSLVCRPGCEIAGLARAGAAVPCHRLVLETPRGPRRVMLATIALSGEERLCLHVICGGAPARAMPDRVPLTPRQFQVLEQLAEGVPSKVIALRLGIAQPTVRNHIRAILAKLDAHSQLEALANARRAGFV
jgi:DNA-binding CsgD family transcriptional regulator